MQAEGNTCRSREACPMVGGDGQHSYTKNSVHQKRVLDHAKELIKEAILDGLEVNKSCSPNIFRIADFGCSTGPNTFLAMQNIVDAIKSKYKKLGLDSETPEFEVYFNDLASSDFNTLFASLPPERQYYAAGVPGSFYYKVFPNGSIDIAHSSYSIHWLSTVPEQVLDRSSDAWNAGRIHYGNAPEPVIQAYATQFQKDINSFLHFRAQEIVIGGLMFLSMAGRHNGTPHSESTHVMFSAALGSCIMELVTKGVDEEKASSFNLPTYVACVDEFAEVINRNGCFSIEEMRELPSVLTGPPSYANISLSIRVVVENDVKAHFGESIDMDDLFNLFTKKLEASTFIFEKLNCPNIFAVLKRK